MTIGSSFCKRLRLESLEPTIDGSRFDVVPLGKLGLRDAVFVRNCGCQLLCRLLSLFVVECLLQFLDGDLVEMIRYSALDCMSRKF